MQLKLLFATLAAAGLSACGTETSWVHPGRTSTVPQGQSALRPIAGCDDLATSLKSDLQAHMEQEVANNLDTALAQLGSPYACSCYVSDTMDNCFYPDAGADSANGAGTPAPNERASEYTTTNNQVAGVDEADFVKTDGAYVYTVTASELTIMDAWPAPQTHIVSRTTLDGQAQRLFVEGDKALVYSTQKTPSCGYDPSPKEQMSIYDITDRSAPKLVRTITLGGHYVSARRIGNAVHSVYTFPNPLANQLPTWPANLNLCNNPAPTEDDVRAAFAALLEENRAKIADTSLVDLLPGADDTLYNGATPEVREGLFLDCQGFYAGADNDSTGFLSVLSLRLDDTAPVMAATILGEQGTVYASSENLYVATLSYGPADPEAPWGYNEITRVHKFALSDIGKAPAYLASGSVAGRLVNQFAMDENDGYLRLATTVGHPPDPDASNNLFVLREQDVQVPPSCENCEADAEPSVETTLAQVGALTGLAPGEDIRSVRFDDDRGFVVTFKKTDPLFTFDLSDPTAPRLTGELLIPGFSTYMHFMDKNHLLTVGFDADDQGSFAWFQGVMLQVFDVSDMSAPTLLHKEIIGTRGTTSDATDDHLAFTYLASRGLLALPMGICDDSSGGGDYGSTLTFNGLLVYQVSAENGFTFLGGIDHRDSAADTQYGCYNWWQSPNSQVKRSIIMDDYVFSLSQQRLLVNSLDGLNSNLADIALPASDNTCTWYN